MTWLYGAIGLALGLAVGWAMCAFVSRAILDGSVRAPGALRYIDQLLGDEAA